MQQDTIGNWTPTTLIKFVRDLQDQQPKIQYSTLQVDYLDVIKSLTLTGDITVPTRPAYSLVGGQGQPAFQNSWVNWGAGGLGVAGYWKDPFGFIHLKGAIKSGTISTAAFTLPPGYRPPEYRVFPAIKVDAGVTSLARVDVNTDGTVVPQTAPATGYITLDGIYFRLTV